MIHPLESKHCRRASPLFQGSHLKLHIDAVVEGNSPGRIWVDDAKNPGSAYMWDGGHCHYFAGKSDRTDFTESLGSLLAGEIIPRARERGFSFFKAYHTPGWEESLAEVFEDRRLSRRGRVFHAFRKSHVGDAPIPEDFLSLRIDETLLLRDEVENADFVREEISSCWVSLDTFLRNGFGFLVRRADRIVGWCTAEYRSGAVCGIGIETMEGYEGRGLATAMASSFVRHSLSSGITPHWDSWTDNIPSLRVAEKVGFEKVEEYTIYAGSF